MEPRGALLSGGLASWPSASEAPPPHNDAVDPRLFPTEVDNMVRSLSLTLSPPPPPPPRAANAGGSSDVTGVPGIKLAPLALSRLEGYDGDS